MTPPMEMAANAAVEHGALITMAVLAAATLFAGLLHWAKSGRPIVLLLFLAGGGMMLMEPMVDTAGGCWFPADSIRLYTGWGRPIPLWLGLTYFVYFGAGGSLIWAAMSRGASIAQIWAIYIGEIVADIVLETVLLDRGVYTYYGNQPLLLGHFPLWWAPVNALVSLAAATMTLVIARRFAGWRLLGLIPVLLSTSAAVNAAAGWPSWFVINSDVSPLLTQLGGLATVAIAFTIVHIVARSVAAPATRSISPGDGAAAIA